MHMSDKTPWMPADEYGRGLRSLTLNLLVRDVGAALPFHREVLDAEQVYADVDFAVFRRGTAEWNLHADHTYAQHPLYQQLAGAGVRGLGAELRLHGRDPDAAEAAARSLGMTIMAATADKPHGLREAYILDPDGYIWVPDVPLAPRP